ncbi:ATP-binding protein [Nonomuraea longispora]|uniref:ATP-binding protein n=1 Tax=Nonomuraea longispora TaxID=1848320 RepID=UPI0024827CFF|nr:ATP-binding protein [Nonomuraea longispora]
MIVTEPNCCSRFSPKGEETNSVAIASNESFSGWTKTFTEPRLCAAIVDRLTYGGNIIETGTESYRLAQTRAQANAATVAGKAAG